MSFFTADVAEEWIYRLWLSPVASQSLLREIGTQFSFRDGFSGGSHQTAREKHTPDLSKKREATQHGKPFTFINDLSTADGPECPCRCTKRDSS
jgi:hypothetical protein